jgi:hypothetical protein
VERRAQACADDRKRLVTMLPGMLKRIQLGMERAELPEADRVVFLGHLVDCHAAAMKAGMRGLAPCRCARAGARARVPELERSTVPWGT